MSINNLVCECCLGQLKKISNNIYKCTSCDKEYIDKSLSNEEIIWLASANQTLRKGNFDDAYEEFSNIVSKYPNSYEAYYGMVLATHGVLFVDDNLENKKVPTCNLSISSFLEDENFKKTLHYAPEELKENFLEQARKIEVIRKEWLDKASKEAPYDIFISFKQSDREKNLEKTKDYYSALELYNHLTYKCGLKVFFSPETLKNKISEQYEPYIYNALNTSKLMIVYGENPEYLNSTWVKNEWIRFLRKIKNKEKEPNSLVVVYKGFDAYNLPKELSSMQALNKDSIDFLDTLLNHINKVFETTDSKQKLERKEIKVGQIATRSRTIGENQIVKRELGTGVVVTKDATVVKILESIDLLISNKQFDMAKMQIANISNNDSSKLQYFKYLVENKIGGTNDLINILSSNTNNIELNRLDELILSLNKEEATKIVNAIKNSLINKINKYYIVPKEINQSLYEDELVNIYNLLSQYEYEESSLIDNLILEASYSKGSYLKLFKLSLRTLQEDEIDDYIKYTLSFVNNLKEVSVNKNYVKDVLNIEVDNIRDLKIYMLKELLKIDNGNEQVLIELFRLTNEITYIETLLSFTKDNKSLNKKLANFIHQEKFKVETPIKDLLQLIPEENKELYLFALNKSYKLLKQELTMYENYVEIYLHKYIYVMELLIKEGQEDSNIILDLYLAKLGYVKLESLVNYSIKLKTTEDFVMLLPKLDLSTQQELLKVAEEQANRINKEAKAKYDKEQHEKYLKAKEEEEKLEEAKNRSIKRTKIFLSIIFYLIGFALTYAAMYFTAKVFKGANQCYCLRNWELEISRAEAKSIVWVGPVLSIIGFLMILIGSFTFSSTFGIFIGTFSCFLPMIIGCANVLTCLNSLTALPLIALGVIFNIVHLYIRSRK